MMQCLNGTHDASIMFHLSMWDRCAYRAFTQACTTEKYSKQGAHSKACIAPQYGDVAENVIFNICNYKKNQKTKEKNVCLRLFLQ